VGEERRVVSRRLRTTLTIQVRLPLPPGSNAAAVLAYVREAIQAHKARYAESSNPIAALQVTEMIVKLERKDTVYL